MTEQAYVGIDLGGGTFKIAVANAEGEIFLESRKPTRSEEGPEGVIRRMGEAVTEALDECGKTAAAVAIGAPGTLDIPNGVVKFLANFPTHWPDVPICDMLKKQLGVPVYLFNDGRAATLGEYDYGKGRGVGTMVYLGLGTGVGGGVVIDGQLRLGPLGSAGELGHMIVQSDGRPCGCGSNGCLETYISGPALTGEAVRLLRSGQAPRLHELTGGDGDKVNPKVMGQAAREGDDKLREAIANAARHLGVAITNLCVTLHPELFVIGGGVAGLGEDLLFEPVRKTLREKLTMFPVDDIRIEAMELGENAGMMGAVAVAVRGGLIELFSTGR